MREIKFRAQRIQTREWVYGNLIIDARGRAHIVPFKYFDEDGHHLSYEDDTDMSVFIDQETVGEFTGLHDKNGREIYEGDRVRVSHGGRHYWLFEIKALGGQFGNNLYGVCYEHNLSTNEDDSTYTYEKVTGNFYRSECVGGKDSEVIGNIHENPELLNVDC